MNTETLNVNDKNNFIDKNFGFLSERMKYKMHSLLKFFNVDSKYSIYIYGSIDGQHTRKHKLTGICEFVLWKKGDQAYVDGVGHLCDKWVRYGDGHNVFFVPYPSVNV